MKYNSSILLLLFFISFSTGQVSGHTKKVDSLMYLISGHTQEDTTRVNLLNQLGNALYNKDTKQSEAYAVDAYKLANKLNDNKGKAYSLWVRGMAVKRKDPKQALIYFKQADLIAAGIKDNANRCSYLIAISNIYRNTGNKKECSLYLQKALKVAETLDDKDVMAKCLINISRENTSKGEYVDAARQLQSIIGDSGSIKDKALLAKAYANLATVNAHLCNYPTALDYYYKALALYEKTGEKSAYLLGLINIAGIQAEHKDRNAAIKTANSALKTARENKDSAYISLSYALLGNLHILSDKPKALSFYKTALSIPGTTPAQLVTIYMRMGTIYTAFKDFDNASLYFNKAIQIAINNKFDGILCGIYRRYSEYFLARKEYTEAIGYASKATELAVKTNTPLYKEEALKQLSKIYAEMGRYKEAFTCYREHTAIRDSIFKENNLRKLALLESNFAFSQEREKYEQNKAQNEQLLGKQKQLIWLLVVITALIIILSCVLFRWAQLKKRYLTLELEHMNQELDTNRKDIAMAQLKLIQNSERDVRTVKMLEEIADHSETDGRKNIRNLIGNYKQEAFCSNWDEFEKLFSHINTPFCENLNKRYPDLTPNERRLCVFMKLNMSNKDIAQITFQTEEALKKSRMRLRRKLNLDRSINLSSFIQNI